MNSLVAFWQSFAALAALAAVCITLANYLED
jgi:hypothetical protein